MATTTATDQTQPEAMVPAEQRRGREEGSELARVLATIDNDEEGMFKPPRTRLRPVWLRQGVEERAAGKLRRALARYHETSERDTHQMARIFTAAHADWHQAEREWLAAISAGAEWQEIERLERRELAGWRDFTFALELLDTCVSDQVVAGRRLYDVLHACGQVWDAVRGLIRVGEGGEVAGEAVTSANVTATTGEGGGAEAQAQAQAQAQRAAAACERADDDRWALIDAGQW